MCLSSSTSTGDRLAALRGAVLQFVAWPGAWGSDRSFWVSSVDTGETTITFLEASYTMRSTEAVDFGAQLHL